MASKRKTVQMSRKKVKTGGSPHLEVVAPGSTGLDARPLREYEKEMLQVVKKGIIPGCVSLVFHKDKVVHASAAGLADVEQKTPYTFNTFCRMYCATKPFITMAFARLVEAEHASFDDCLEKYIPEFAKTKVQLEGCTEQVQPKRPILLKHLLCHTSGIGYAPDVGENIEDDITQAYWDVQQDVQKGSIKSLADFARRIAKIPLSYHPGTEYYYGFSFDILGRVLEVITGKSLEKVLVEWVFKPLGMSETKWALSKEELPRLAACYSHKATWKKVYGQRQHASAPRPSLVRIDGLAPKDSHWLQGQQCRVLSGGGFMGYLYGGVVSTVSDTARFVQMIMRKGRLPTGRFLKASTVTQLEKNRMKQGVDPVNYLGNIGTYRLASEYGMGGAACTYWSIDREDDTAAIWFTQHIDMPEIADMKGIHNKKADLWNMLHHAVVRGSRQSRKRPASANGAPRKRAKTTK